MNTGIRYIGIVICWLCFVLVVDANLNEPRTIQELLDQKIGGFRFYLEWEKQQNQLMIKKADGASISFGQTMLEIKNYLENNPEKIFTLFLDLGSSRF